MSRPEIKLEKETIDIVMEVLGAVGLVVLIGLPIYFYSDLPETISIHFGWSGKANGYGSKNMIWLLPILGLLVHIGMVWLNRIPHRFNYPQKVTQENARRLYMNGTRVIRTLNVVCILTFIYISWVVIQVSIGRQTGIGGWFVVLLIIVISGLSFYFYRKSTDERAEIGET